MTYLIKIFLLNLCIILALCQFSSYVPQFIADTPPEFIQPVPLTESIDNYVQFRSPSTTVDTTQKLKSVRNANQKVAIAQKAGLGFLQTNAIFSDSNEGQAAVPKQLVLQEKRGETNLESRFCRFPFLRINGVCRCPRFFRLIFGRCVIDNDNDNNDDQDDSDDNNNTGPGTGTVQCPVLKINSRLRQGTIQALAQISRSFDGKDNNQDEVDWGSAGALLDRRVGANYVNDVNQPINNLPGPRVVSNTIGSQSRPIIQSRVRATIAFTIFGQFIDHDIDLTPAQRGNQAEALNIEIPPGDRFFANQQFIRFSRSQFVQRPGQSRRHPNVVTSWIDGSQIYGSSNTTACALRTFRGGKLKVSKQRQDQFLPLFDGLFRAGDGRVLQNSILTSFHTIFLRQHNRLCDRIAQSNPNLNDETIFQIARNFVIGLLQKITMKDFVPILLGDQYNRVVGRYRGYRNNIKPNIPTEFSTASYRLGHSLLIESIPAINANGRITKRFRLNELFFKQNLITSQFINNILRGSARTLTKEKSSQLVDDVRNLLVLDPQGQVKLDLFSLNIQRGRDHGLPTYNQARAVFGLPRIRNFQQLLPNGQADVARRLRQVYGSPDKLQLFVGIIAEKPVRNGIVGQLGAQIVGQTFRNLRDADRFWYENTFPRNVLAQIQRTQLGDIIRRNSGARDIPSNIFRLR